jgi:hypothetical protein
MQHIERGDCHRGELTPDELCRIAIPFDCPLADVDRLVADAFEIRDEPQRCCQKTQIVGDRLSECQNPQDERMNLKLIAVDLGVECLYVSRDLGGTPAESPERHPDDSFTPSAHRKQVGLQLA